jgi:hypothetical protein
MKRVSPYTTLKKEAEDWARKVAHPHRKVMWTYPKEKLKEGWNVSDLAERVAAADQLGYDVKLENRTEGLTVIYVKRPPDVPYLFAP